MLEVLPSIDEIIGHSTDGIDGNGIAAFGAAATQVANRKKGGWGKLKNRRATMKSRVNILPEFSLPTTMTDHQHDGGMHGELDFENQPVSSRKKFHRSR